MLCILCKMLAMCGLILVGQRLSLEHAVWWTWQRSSLVVIFCDSLCLTGRLLDLDGLYCCVW